jgi:hypothetical protein
LAGAYFRGEVVSGKRQKTDAEKWVEDAYKLGDRKLVEEAHVMERYGQVMSVLTLP